ncbi:hypothetical protein F4779DRAFT_238821 [Xylariaceae sp. FL0662B]|nr:hypothetical protein F4779DRAFT_238821 [Xylariaceae sp. FL0662B]
MASQLALRRENAQGKQLITSPVFDIFYEYLQPESTVSAAQAAAAISQLAPAPSGETNTLDDGFLWQLWADIIAVAEQIPHDHAGQDRLVRFMRELTLLPDTGVTVWEKRFWTDLPVLGAAWREHLNGPGHADAEEAQAEIDTAWVRFHAFSARLIGAGVARLENQPIWMLRDALEEKEASPTVDRDLMVAAMYIEYAGPVLVEALAADPDPELDDRRRRMLRGGALFPDTTGLRLERWSFWIRRFRELAEKTGSGDSRAMALRAARLMEVWSEKRLEK